MARNSRERTRILAFHVSWNFICWPRPLLPSAPASGPTISMDGEHWTLSVPLDINPKTLPPNVYMQYVSGSGRVPSPIPRSIEMSDLTLAAFATTTRYMPERPPWIDAFLRVHRAHEEARCTLKAWSPLHARRRRCLWAHARVPCNYRATPHPARALRSARCLGNRKPANVSGACRRTKHSSTAARCGFTSHAHDGGPRRSPAAGNPWLQVLAWTG